MRLGLAELCVGDAEPETVADRLRSWGITLLDVSQSSQTDPPSPSRHLGASTYASGQYSRLRGTRALVSASRFS